MSKVSAREMINVPEKGISSLTTKKKNPKNWNRANHSQLDELAVFDLTQIDIQDLVAKIYNLGDVSPQTHKKITTPSYLRDAIIDCVFEDAIDSTPTVTITVHDADWDLLNYRALNHTIDINPGSIKGRWYRLDAFDVNDEEITMTFATRNAVYLSYQKKPYAISRNKMTRALFILTLLHHVKKTRIKMYCPQLRVKQPIAKGEALTLNERKGSRSKGISHSDDVSLEGRPLDPVQIKCANAGIEAGIDSKAHPYVILAGVAVLIVESRLGTMLHTPGSQFSGPWQQSAAYGWPETGDTYKDGLAFYKAANKLYKSKGTKLGFGMFCETVQGAINQNYAFKADKARPDAERILKKYGGLEVSAGVSGGSREVEGKPEAYKFMIGEPDGGPNENYLAAMYRLAQEVNWRAYWVGDVLHFMSEEDLFKAQARIRLRRFKDGVENVSFSYDRQKKVQEMHLRVRMHRWVCPVGTVVIFDEGGPAKGRWLVTNIRRSAFDTLGDITLSQPMTEKKEPPHKKRTKNLDDSGSTTGDMTDGGLANVDSKMTPKEIIDRLVLPKARAHGMATGIDPAGVVAANAAHSTNVAGSSNISMHKGPPDQAWAVDMSNGGSPTPEMDALCDDLLSSFEMGALPNPNSTGGMENNLVNANHGSFKYQLLYRTITGGNHYNHVHFGIRRIK